MAACSNSYYDGPKSGHFDGKHFSAPEPVGGKSFLTVLKWRLTGNRIKWPASITTDMPDKPPVQVTDGTIRTTMVGHASVLMQTRGLNILCDPIWSERASPVSWWGPKRVRPPGINWDDLPKIDVVTISHSHYDHLDIPTIKKLAARDNPVFYVPLGVDTIIRKHAQAARIVAMDWGQTVAHNQQLKIHAEPTQHWSARTPWDRNESLWAAFVLDLPDGKIYVAGDTGYGTIFKKTGEKYGGFRLALIPIGAYEPRWFMKPSHANPHEAVEIFKDLKAQHAVAIHWGTFQLTDEGIDEPPRDLRLAMTQSRIPEKDFDILLPGQITELK